MQHRLQALPVCFVFGAALQLVSGCSSASDGDALADEINGTESTALVAAADEVSGNSVSSSAASDNTVVFNANVYTVDEANPTAEAFAYDADGIIIAVGSEADVRAAAGEEAVEIDAGGHLVLPGFQDSHVHVPEAGINEGLCFFEAGLDLDDYEELAAECADEQADSDWVRAAGPSLFEFRQQLEAGGELPIDVLDRAIPDRPALVLDDLGHAVWTNTLGLEAAGIGPDDADPQGGVFHRDPATDRLSGLLLEDAQQLVRNAARPSDVVADEGLAIAMEQLAANGVTTISDAGGYWQQGYADAWQRADDRGELTVRAHNTLYVYPDADQGEQLAELEARFSNDADSLLQFDTAKVYIDGILDLGTALLLDPYDVPVDPAYQNGFEYFTPPQLEEYVQALHDIGYRINFHVIGDAATRRALDVIEGIDDDPAIIADRRHRTTHTYLVDPADIGRFAEIGMIADFQVGPDSTATDYHEFLSEFIGERAFDLLPVAALVDAGADVTLSSDWDADPLSPFGIIERSLSRDENQLDDVETAVYLVTLAQAHAMGHDDRTGSIAVGKYADYVIVYQDLFTIDTDAIDETKVLATVLAGGEVYRSADF